MQRGNADQYCPIEEMTILASAERRFSFRRSKNFLSAGQVNPVASKPVAE